MDMTWREYLLRLDGHIRQTKEKWGMARMIAYQVYVSTPSRKNPISIEKYLPLESTTKANFSDSMKDSIREQYKKIKEKIYG